MLKNVLHRFFLREFWKKFIEFQADNIHLEAAFLIRDNKKQASLLKEWVYRHCEKKEYRGALKAGLLIMDEEEQADALDYIAQELVGTHEEEARRVIYSIRNVKKRRRLWGDYFQDPFPSELPEDPPDKELLKEINSEKGFQAICVGASILNENIQAEWMKTIAEHFIALHRFLDANHVAALIRNPIVRETVLRKSDRLLQGVK